MSACATLPVTSPSRPGTTRRMAGTAVIALFDLLATWHARAAGRSRLAALDDFARRDLAIGAADVEHEIEKPFWRA